MTPTVAVRPPTPRSGFGEAGSATPRSGFGEAGSATPRSGFGEAGFATRRSGFGESSCESFAPLTIRPATAADADAIHGLISEHVDEGRLLPRDSGEILVHAHRFVVAVDGNRVVACADLAPLSRNVAEVRSLVVSDDARSQGIGRRLIDELIGRATAAGYEKLCAFTHAAAYFVQLGFSLVPHVWLPEKIETDCRTCSQFRKCGQYAVVLGLTRARQSCVPLASLHG